MASRHSHEKIVAIMAIEILVTFVSVMAQSDGSGCKGCFLSQTDQKSTVSFLIIKNTSDAFENPPDCFPYETVILYTCKTPNTHQFSPSNYIMKLNRTCTGSGWQDDDATNNLKVPKCVERQQHCSSPPAPSSQNVLVQIDSQNVTFDKNNMTQAYYSENTIVIYNCKHSKLNANTSQRLWRCKKNEDTSKNYTWEPINQNEKELVCDSNEKLTSVIGSFILTTVSTSSISENQNDRPNGRQGPESFDNSSLLRNLLIGICSFLGFVLIAVFFGVLHRNRTRPGKNYEDVAYNAEQPPFTSMSEEKSKLEQNFNDGEENAQYTNIIPIKVNQETIYTEVETGKIGKSVPTIKRNIDDEQSTVYAEIHHSAIPKDQRR